MVRLSRKDAAARLDVSMSTIDRMVKKGQLRTQTDQHGQNHTVWILMDDEEPDDGADRTAYAAEHTPEYAALANELQSDDGEHAETDIQVELATLRTENTGLLALVDLYKDRLADADWRYQELLAHVRAITPALAASPASEPERKKRRWWPFR